jgi:hypothetical protein
MNRNVVGSIYGSPSQAVSEEKIFYESTNQQHELPVLAMFVNGSKMSNLYRGPSIDATDIGSNYGRPSIKIAHLVPIR